MSVNVKICGLRDANGVAAAVAGGAAYLGFVYYPYSPRMVEAAASADLMRGLPAHIRTVGLFVDPRDDEIRQALAVAPVRMIQLHGAETPERVAAIRAMSGLPLIKAVGVATAQDLEEARKYHDIADMMLFDAKPTAQSPGGNAHMFDWTIMKNRPLPHRWMLAGGLNEGNIAEAAIITGASVLDVSSGVEDAPGHKNPAKIKAFLARAREIETCS